MKTIWDVYGKAADKLPDPVWIRDCAKNGWVALTRDYLREHRQLMRGVKSRIFRIGRAAGNADTQIEWLEANRFRLDQQGRRPGPYMRVIRQTTIDPYWP